MQHKGLQNIVEIQFGRRELFEDAASSLCGPTLLWRHSLRPLIMAIFAVGVIKENAVEKGGPDVI